MWNNFLNILSLVIYLITVSGYVNSQVVVKLDYPEIEKLKFSDVWQFQVINKVGEELIVLAEAKITNEKDSILYHAVTGDFILLASDTVQHFTDRLFQPVSLTLSHVDMEKRISDAGIYSFCVYIILSRNHNRISRDCLRIIISKH